MSRSARPSVIEEPDFRGAGGFPAYGNQRTAWDAGSHPDHADPEYR